MIKVLDMQFIRYVNIFNKVTRLRCTHCFEYNNTIVFAVPKHLVLRSIGPNNKNLETLNRITGKRIKIIAIPRGKEDIENFVATLIRPLKFRAIELKDNEAIINTLPQNKASLIGKNKVRLSEMENILGQYFNIKSVRIK